MSEAKNSDSAVRNLIDEEVDTVAGGTQANWIDGTCRYEGSNAWEQWIADYYKIYL